MMTTSGLNRLIRFDTARPSERATVRTAVRATASPLGRRGEYLGHRLAADRPGVTGQAQQRLFADERLDAAVAAAAAQRAGRIEHHVPDLAGEAAGAGELDRVGDDAAADADLAVDVDAVRSAARGAAQVFGQRAEVGVVAEAQRHRRRQRRG